MTLAHVYIFFFGGVNTKMLPFEQKKPQVLADAYNKSCGIVSSEDFLPKTYCCHPTYLKVVSL